MTKDRLQRESPSLSQELIGVLGLVSALFLFFCLVTSSPDLSLSSAVREPAGNWGGRVGQFAAGLLFDLLGFSAFWLVALLAFFSIRFFSPKASFQRIAAVCAGCTGVLVASSGLLASTGLTSFNLFGKSFPAGGYLGNMGAGFLTTYFGRPGAVLLFAALFLVSLMASVRFSPYRAGCRLRQELTRLRGWYVEQRANRGLQAAAAPRRIRQKESGREEGGADALVVVPKVREPVRLVPENEDQEFQLLPAAPGQYQLPGLNLLDKPGHREIKVDHEHYYAVSKQLEEILVDFGVSGKVVGISPGPIVTTYEFSPAPGVKINKIVSLADDLALGLKAESVRILGTIPGKAALGIEIPNPERQIVHIRDILVHEAFQKSASKLSLGLGMDVVGNPVVADLARMPHLLIAGATGSGKSVAVNTIICSILLKATPAEVRLLMVDPKRIELSGYEAIPHLLHPVVVDPKMASRALQWAVREMERRYQQMEELRVKSINSYNEVAETKLPLIVIIIDELADLMMVSSRDVEDAVARLAQMARAAGMHLILATQRPSVDVLTGLIKANFPTRISFKVSSKIDSRTIIDTSGAEHLLGAGDMLFLPPGTAKLQRIHGAYISEKETERIVSFLREQGSAAYDESVLQEVEQPGDGEAAAEDDYDEKYDEAVALVCETGQASISMVQRRLRVGYNRAARMIEIMEKEGVVGPADGAKPREVLARKGYVA